MEKYDVIAKKLSDELDSIERKFSNGEGMTNSDLDKIDKITHAMKCLATYRAMVNAEERSGKMTRSYDNGGMEGEKSFADGYSRGFYDARNGYTNGHEMMYHPVYYGNGYEKRNW